MSFILYFVPTICAFAWLEYNFYEIDKALKSMKRILEDYEH